jgi:hypothetical protein
MPTRIRISILNMGDTMKLIPANDNNNLGKMRRLDASDERSLDHPSHREQWLEMAMAIGRQIARDEMNGHVGQHVGG